MFMVSKTNRLKYIRAGILFERERAKLVSASYYLLQALEEANNVDRTVKCDPDDRLHLARAKYLFALTIADISIRRIEYKLSEINWKLLQRS